MKHQLSVVMALLLKENLDLLSMNANSRAMNSVGSITLKLAQGF